MKPFQIVALLAIASFAAFSDQSSASGGLCNAEPLLIPSIVALHKTLSPAEVASRLAIDPDYAIALGTPTILNSQVNAYVPAHIAYPPLVRTERAPARVARGLRSTASGVPSATRTTASRPTARWSRRWS